MSSEQEETILDKLPQTRWVLIAAVGFVLVCVFGALLVWSQIRGRGDASDTNDNTAVGNNNISTPTPFSLPDAEPTAVPQNQEPLIVGISDSDTITVSLDTPISLQLGGQEFGVTSQQVSPGGQWTPNANGSNTAVWVYGTVVNYVVAIPFSESNQFLLESLTPGEEMVLFTRGGTDFTFAFESRMMVSADSPDVFSQLKPGLTLLLWGGEGPERMVVTARYQVPEVSSSDESGLVELGEPAQLGDMQFTVSGASYLAGRQEAPAGFAFYLVDYSVQNAGLTAVDAANLQLMLIDELGNQYAPNPVASQLGNFPNLTGFINAGQTSQATAGYQIPVGLNSTSLIWVASTPEDGRLQVRIPFTEGSNDATAAVTLTRADVSTDLTNLILGGQVSNLGTQPVNVTEENIRLETADGSVYLLLSTNPPFPWVAAPGETVEFLVTFQRPSVADTATFTVLNQAFAISNYR